MIPRTKRIGALAMLAIFSGCGSKFERYPLEGTVNLDGQPLSNCMVIFAPCDAGASGATGMVVDGRFAIRQDSGATPGKYNLIFTEIQPDLEEYEQRRADNVPPLNAPTLPRNYQAANEVHVDVMPVQDNRFEIELNSNGWVP